MNIIFDFDGTIADSLGTILDYANELLIRQNLKPVTKKELRTKGVKGILTSRKISKLRLYYYIFVARRNEIKHIDQVQLFPDLDIQLKKLAKNNRLGIITSSAKNAVNKILEENKLASYFDFVQSEFGLFNKHQKIKKAINWYHLDAQQTFYIGDETRDIEAAKKAGVRSIGVTWGFEGEKLIRKAKPDVVVYKPEELVKAVQRLAREA